MNWFILKFDGYYLRGYLRGKPLLTPIKSKGLPMSWRTCTETAGFFMRNGFDEPEFEPCLD